MSNPGKNYTIFTDASLCPNTNVAGYAYWSRDNVVKYDGSKAEENIPNSTVAEIRAMAWALHCISQRVDLTNRNVIFTVDCKGANEFFETGPKGKLSGPLVEKPYQYFLAMQRRIGFTVQYNWIKGHKGHGTARKWVNNFCDQAARREMRKLRDHILKTTHALT